MNPQRAAWILALSVLAFQTGCLSFINPLVPPPIEEIRSSVEIPQECLNKVHIFFLHGLDPLDASNFTGLHDWVSQLGYRKTHFGQVFHCYHFLKQIRKLHKEDPDAKIALIGFSYGAGMIRDLACSLREDGIEIELIVYLDGVELNGRPLHRPANVRRVVHVMCFNRPDRRNVDEGENYRLEDVWHFATVTHPVTLRVLVKELGQIASSVPVVHHPPAAITQLRNQERTLTQSPQIFYHDQWQFLKPDFHCIGTRGAKPVNDALNTPPAWANTPDDLNGATPGDSR
jgi:hypothetical protein